LILEIRRLSARAEELRANPTSPLQPIEPLIIPNTSVYKLDDWPDPDNRILKSERWRDEVEVEDLPQQSGSMNIKQIHRPRELAQEECLFCSFLMPGDRSMIATNDLFFAVPDQFPVNAGHTLLIPKRHVSKLADLRDDELLSFGHFLKEVQRVLASLHPVDGFNIGVNEGDAAGQTIEHLHVHLIPRFTGDVENPRGGIRNLKPPLAEY
jgi:diadenosine tetraphosphate (Ap4A) HIT family hydrolase